MKCCSCRMDIGHDLDDIRFLIEHLGLDKKEDVVKIVLKYVPEDRIPAKTTFFIEEVFSKQQKR
ncbi:MAG: hypothetical protein GXP32_02955 [Kiritimatiellaeota bacterium]|nr:hypothetical protein [Kiritimatiellota bacterium]